MRILLAIAVSLAVHALLAVLLLVGLARFPKPVAHVTLDLSSVELSVSEKEEDDAAAVSQASVPSPSQQEIRPPQALEAPPMAKSEAILPPDPHAMKFPEPREDRPQVKTPPRPVQPAAPESRARPAPVQAQVTAPPRPRRAIRPQYPRSSRERGEEGNVTLEISVDEDGACNDVKIVVSSGFSALDEAARKAVRSARFMPAKSGDRAVRSTARLTLTFRLKER